MGLNSSNLPYSKESQLHRVRQTSKNKNFSTRTKGEIFIRDGFKCVRCGTSKDLESVPHHIIFKSQGGRGTADNGATVCRTCHRLAHSKDRVRRWFEDYRIKHYL